MAIIISPVCNQYLGHLCLLSSWNSKLVLSNSANENWNTWKSTNHSDILGFNGWSYVLRIHCVNQFIFFSQDILFEFLTFFQAPATWGKVAFPGTGFVARDLCTFNLASNSSVLWVLFLFCFSESNWVNSKGLSTNSLFLHLLIFYWVYSP